MKVYLDNAATTKLDPRVLKIMNNYFLKSYANPASIHIEGQEIYLELEEARKKIAKILGLDARGIVFTSSATEANNLIITGFARANKDKKRNKILISKLEHPAVFETAEKLKSEGFVIDYLESNKKGIIEVEELKRKIDNKTLLVSVMAVNNEIGTINDIESLAEIAHSTGAYFHSDAVQAIPYLKINATKMGLDFLSISAHKFNGPKGVGMAYIRPGLKVEALITGGGQENNIRSGTHNTPGIMGMLGALELAYKERTVYLKEVRSLRSYFWKNLKKEIPDIAVNACLKSRVAANLNIMFSGVEGEAILIDLASKGISVSTGSACSAANLKSSRILQAIGLNDFDLNSNIRFSFGRFNNKKEIDYTIKALKETIIRLRSFSPLVGNKK